MSPNGDGFLGKKCCCFYGPSACPVRGALFIHLFRWRLTPLAGQGCGRAAGRGGRAAKVGAVGGEPLVQTAATAVPAWGLSGASQECRSEG